MSQTQTQKILQYMRDFGSINPSQAYNDLGVYRLSARIAELRERGYNIGRELITSKNRYGDTVRYARYMLRGEPV